MEAKSILFLVWSIMSWQSIAANYIPNPQEQKFADHIKNQSFVKAVEWSQQGSLWLSVINSPGTNASLYEQLSYGICNDGNQQGLNNFFVHIWDAQAMLAGKMKRLTDKVYCQ